MIFDDWAADMPCQFQDKKNIRILLSAFADELEELQQAIEDIGKLTDIDSQSGVNLDHIGDIVSMNRKDAYSLLKKPRNTVVTDENYRNVLKFKILQNTSDCTYADIIEGIRLLWGDFQVRYSEDKDIPAAYTLDLGVWDISENDITSAAALTIRAAGVRAIYLIAWDIYTSHAYWRSKVILTECTAVIQFFEGIQRIDGTLRLDGSAQLDAASAGAGEIAYYMHLVSWVSTCSSSIEDAVFGYEYLTVTPGDGETGVSTTWSTAGELKNTLVTEDAVSAAYDSGTDSLVLTYEADVTFGVAGA